MCIESFPDAGRKDISQAVQQLLTLAVEGPLAISAESQTNADMLAGLRGAVSLPHNNSAFLPILPDGAAELLSRLLNKHMAPTKEGLLDNSHQLVVLLLTAQLCKAASRGKSLDAGLAHQIAAVACRSGSALAPNVHAEHAACQLQPHVFTLAEQAPVHRLQSLPASCCCPWGRNRKHLQREKVEGQQAALHIFFMVVDCLQLAEGHDAAHHVIY